MKQLISRQQLWMLVAYSLTLMAVFTKGKGPWNTFVVASAASVLLVVLALCLRAARK